MPESGVLRHCRSHFVVESVKQTSITKRLTHDGGIGIRSSAKDSLFRDHRLKRGGSVPHRDEVMPEHIERTNTIQKGWLDFVMYLLVHNGRRDLIATEDVI